MPQPLIIVGAGGFGREVAWLARSLPDQWSLVGFLDDDDRLQGRVLSGLPVLGKVADRPQYPDAWLVVALGAPRTRHAVVTRLLQTGDVRFATLVHPSAHRNEFCAIGEGSIVCAGSVVSDHTTIGRHCIVNALTTIGHDAVIRDYSTLASQIGVGGHVSIGRGCELGTGVIAVPGVSLGDGCLCCAGSVVANPVAAGAVVAGNPARRVKDIPPFPVEN